MVTDTAKQVKGGARSVPAAALLRTREERATESEKTPPTGVPRAPVRLEEGVNLAERLPEIALAENDALRGVALPELDGTEECPRERAMATTKTCTDARGTVRGHEMGVTHTPVTDSTRTKHKSTFVH